MSGIQYGSTVTGEGLPGLSPEEGSPGLGRGLMATNTISPFLILKHFFVPMKYTHMKSTHSLLASATCLLHVNSNVGMKC